MTLKICPNHMVAKQNESCFTAVNMKNVNVLLLSITIICNN